MTYDDVGIRASRGPRFAAIALSILLLAVAGFTPGRTGEADADPADVETLRAIRTVSLSVGAYRLDNATVPGPTGGWVEAEFLLPHVQPVYLRSLPTRDGWGRDLFYWSDGSRYAVVSYGADGLADRPYAAAPWFDERAGDDFVSVDGSLVSFPSHVGGRIQADRQKQTMADMRSIATAVKVYRIDNGAVPGPTNGPVEAAWLLDWVVPVYIRTLPQVDGWGTPMVYWSDGESYRLASLGSDGTQDGPFEQIEPGTETQTFTSDIVFADGSFVQFPVGEQH